MAGRFFRPSPRELIEQLNSLPGATHTEIQQQLTALYTGCECHLNNLADGDDWVSQMAAQLAGMVQQVYQDKGMPADGINEAVTTEFRRRLWGGAEEGYGMKLDDIGSAIDYTTPDAQMLKALDSNVWQFSAAKNYQQLKALSQALVGPDGKLRTYAEFKPEAYKINAEHVNQWLRAEYENAVAGSQMAGKWVEIERDSDVLDMLEFDAVIDGRSSDICRPLDGLRAKTSDPIWSIIYPPNHFGPCRSTVSQQSGGQSTAKSKLPALDAIPAMFRTNVGKTGMVFPAGHPYFDGLPDEVKRAATKLQVKNQKRS